jgi:hypothetical protein
MNARSGVCMIYVLFIFLHINYYQSSIRKPERTWRRRMDGWTLPCCHVGVWKEMRWILGATVAIFEFVWREGREDWVALAHWGRYDMQLLARTTTMMMMRCCRTLTCRRSTRGELSATFWAGWVPMGVWRVGSHWKMVTMFVSLLTTILDS